MIVNGVKMNILKIIKEDILLVIVLIIGALFLGYKFYWWNSLSSEEQQQITLTNERNYSYDYLDGVITDIDNSYYWGGTPLCKTEAEIYCTEIDETFNYEENTSALSKPVLWNHEEGEHIKCERVTITDGYGKIVAKYLSGNVELYE